MSKTVTGTHTPMMAQYLAIKASFHSAIVLYRMGGSYKLFYAAAINPRVALAWS